jgi:hypothetical protein
MEINVEMMGALAYSAIVLDQWDKIPRKNHSFRNMET